jgi:hypothetical protein
MQVTQGPFYITTTLPRNRLPGYRVINPDPGSGSSGIRLTLSRAESLYPPEDATDIRWSQASGVAVERFKPIRLGFRELMP